MATRDRCPKCGALVLPDERFCKQCGASLDQTDNESNESNDHMFFREDSAGTEARQVCGEAEPRSEDTPGYTGTPRTIGELLAFCQRNEMPLEKMRFFIGQDYRQPRAFGIYQDGDTFVVYKNKANGSRAVRYQGPDEAYAVNELYQKLLAECHARDIWPDGRPQGVTGAVTRAKNKLARTIKVAMVILFIAAIALNIYFIFNARRTHRHDGYYRFDDGYYYRYGSAWYYNDYVGDWILVSMLETDDDDVYDDYYLGQDYNGTWEATDFRQSDAWQQIEEERHTTSSDYDSWDSGGTDWDSDW